MYGLKGNGIYPAADMCTVMVIGQGQSPIAHGHQVIGKGVAMAGIGKRAIGIKKR